jgi:pimeloyl-ACP methyl ester carboxylesterase
MGPMAEAKPISPPALALLALEGRAVLEFGAMVAAWPMLALSPRGDGHPVLVLPGFLASDRSTRPLRVFLRARGYAAHGWGRGINLGPWPEVLPALEARLYDLATRHDRRVSLVGWSLGGIFARALAREAPTTVRQVITLACPLRAFHATSLGRFFGRGARAQRAMPEILARAQEPLPVPTTAIVSRSDGIVAWQACTESPGPLRETIEVHSSHCGMGHHPAALFVVADRLAQTEGAWRPFREHARGRWPFPGRAVVM